MTDKEQIMIDGCNVLKCRYYQYKTLKDCEMRYPESGDCEIGLINYLFNGNLDMEKLCVDNPNCYFKQRARKTQEFEQLQEKYEALKLENEEGYEIVDELKQECEELKEEEQQLRMQFCNDCGEKDDYNIPCKMIRDLDYGLQKEIEENGRYRKALEEIEEYIKEEEWSLLDYVVRDINDIINKAKGEE